jgi:hypothetical protein
MDHTVLDGHVRGRNFSPSLRLQLGQQLLPDGTVIGVGAARWFIDRHSESLHEVGPAYDPDQFAVAHDRDTLDPVRLQQKGGIGDGSRLGDGEDLRVMTSFTLALCDLM